MGCTCIVVDSTVFVFCVYSSSHYMHNYKMFICLHTGSLISLKVTLKLCLEYWVDVRLRFKARLRHFKIERQIFSELEN